MVSYGHSDCYIDKILFDDKCRNIYQDAVKIISSQTDDVLIKTNELFNLISIYGEHFLIYYCLGFLYDEAQFYESALNCYNMSINLHPTVDAYLNIAVIFHKCNLIDKTSIVLEKALQINKNDLRILNFIGTLHYMNKEYKFAYDYLKKILENTTEKSSNIKNICNNIGFACMSLGKFHKSLQYYDKGLNLQLTETTNTEMVDLQLLQNKLITFDYMYDAPKDTFNDFLHINTILKTIQIFNHEHPHNDHIRVGYISPDLRQHVVACFLEAIFKYFDRNIFDIYCYANVMIEDKKSDQLKSYGLKWFNIYNIDKYAVEKLILSHNIDILIDLAGHTNNNRLDVMALKPAPILMTYLGYPNTTGLTNVDYRITDKYADPINTQQQYTENLLYMPRCFICNTPCLTYDKVPLHPVKHNTITFGVLNKLQKHNEFTFKTWAEIIKRVPNSILLLKRDMKSTMETRMKTLQKSGLPMDRVKILEHIHDTMDFYNSFNDIDICLDTFPYSGTTTSCDTFLNSTPVITLAIPDRHVSNVTKSLLINMGFPELVAYSIDEYVDKAVKLANDPDKIMFYKQTIQKQFAKLMEPTQFSKEYDDLLKKVYIEHKL